MVPLPDALAPWHNFYALLGEAAATMIGLLFVAASVGSGTFSQARRGPLRIFLSASLVQFACILGGSLLIMAPLQAWDALGGYALATGAFGLVYSAVAWRDTVRDGLAVKIDLEDRLWYVVGPVVGYGLKFGAGVALLLGRRVGLDVLAAAMGAMLLVAMHNAWDITVWSVTRRRE